MTLKTTSSFEMGSLTTARPGDGALSGRSGPLPSDALAILR